MSDDYRDDINDENVLKYIYMLRQHLDTMKLFWQGLTKAKKDELVRISDPVAPDDFIGMQISALSMVLAPHNIITQLKRDEKNHIILDTFAAFLQDTQKEPFFNWDLFHTAAESFYNTLHLFLNIAENGFGANFTASIQSGISQKIEGNKPEETVKPYIDLSKHFGFNSKPPIQEPPQVELPTEEYEQ